MDLIKLVNHLEICVAAEKFNGTCLLTSDPNRQYHLGIANGLAQAAKLLRAELAKPIMPAESA